jgi:biopolymer transport protein ExbD
MRKHGMPAAHVSHPNVTPLIDVVMCLIIFFMLVAKIGVSTGADASISIPASILGTDLKDPGNALTLNVREGPNDQPMVTALVDGTSRQPQEIKILDPATNRKPLLEILRRLREGDKIKGIPPKPELKVIIRADQEMGYRFLEPVLITCADAQVRSVNFNTKKQTEAAQ